MQKPFLNCLITVVGYKAVSDFQKQNKTKKGIHPPKSTYVLVMTFRVWLLVRTRDLIFLTQNFILIEKGVGAVFPHGVYMNLIQFYCKFTLDSSLPTQC